MNKFSTFTPGVAKHIVADQVAHAPVSRDPRRNDPTSPGRVLPLIDDENDEMFPEPEEDHG